MTKNLPFDWTRDRAMSLKATLDARDITDDQAEELKQRLAALVAEYLPEQEGTVRVSIAEEGSRKWKPIGDASLLGEPLFRLDKVTGELVPN
jgi:hypothetical protein